MPFRSALNGRAFSFANGPPANPCHVSCVFTFGSTILLSSWGGYMPQRPHRETPIERIFREVTGPQDERSPEAHLAAQTKCKAQT